MTKASLYKLAIACMNFDILYMHLCHAYISMVRCSFNALYCDGNSMCTVQLEMSRTCHMTYIQEIVPYRLPYNASGNVQET